MTHVDRVARAQVEEIAIQIGTTLMADTKTYVNRFMIDSETSSSEYTVSQRRTNGEWCCSCPGWKFHRTRLPNQRCKHLNDILRRLAKVERDRQFDPAVLEMLDSARVLFMDDNVLEVGAVEMEAAVLDLGLRR